MARQTADHDQLRHEGQRLLVDRGRRLHHAEQQAGEQRRDQDRRRGERQDPQRLLGDADEIIGIVGNHLAAPHPVAKEAASEPIVSAQPSTSTNSSNLNGIETIVGDSIIMPSDIKVDETIEVDDQERQEDQEADLERGLQFAGDEGRQQDRERHVLRPGEGRRAGHLGEQRADRPRGSAGS